MDQALLVDASIMKDLLSFDPSFVGSSHLFPTIRMSFDQKCIFYAVLISSCVTEVDSYTGTNCLSPLHPAISSSPFLIINPRLFSQPTSVYFMQMEPAAMFSFTLL